jgi:hypothetical protein
VLLSAVLADACFVFEQVGCACIRQPVWHQYASSARLITMLLSAALLLSAFHMLL